MSATMQDLSVELPAGGILHMQTAEEVDLWRTSLDRYREEYTFAKVNDLHTLGALLQSQINLFRAQTAINGMVPELDSKRVPTGRYQRMQLDASDIAACHKLMVEASKEMRAFEKQLGIDKGQREAGGTHTVDNYLKELKRAAHVRGIHIAERTLAYERVINEAKWKVRMLYEADAEDRAYHRISPKTVLDWLKDEIAALEQLDIEFAAQKGRLFVGKL